ncbi:uncharacterized protein LOC118356817 isoform X1 [Zalophus californianus]|uniref:Uncharacterized protein LOC118356817 isoform X1 n=1 Tax=Zalophus californianus TaxID=9704 RepID=A0A6P9FB03_ZALCA|nr:uncharacterized protein LOC118356817 isoform X1 [Zalophus californianus]
MDAQREAERRSEESEAVKDCFQQPPISTLQLHPQRACKLKGGHTPRRNDTAAPRCLGWPRMASDSRSPAVRRDRGPVRRAPRPGKRGAAGKGAAPSPVTQRTFVGNLVLNHS